MINTILVYLIAGAFIIGVFDKIFLNGRFGLATEIENGVSQVGGLILSLVGIMCFAPLLGHILTPVISPLYHLVGADPANFSGIILGPDGGAFPLAEAMTTNNMVIALSGLFLASMLGVTICFSLPFSLGIVEECDKELLSKGMLAGIISSPFGAVIAGLLAGFPLSFILQNLLIAFIMVILIVLALIKAEKKVVHAFMLFSKIISAIALLSLGFACLQLLTGIQIIPGLESIGNKFSLVGNMGITIGGALIVVSILQRLLKNLLIKLGQFIGINEIAVIAIFMSLANAMPIYSMMKNMDERGKVLSIAFSVPACYALGSHLAYTAVMMPQYIMPEVFGKIICGILAMGIAYILFCRKTKLTIRG